MLSCVSWQAPVSLMLFDRTGHRKYLIAAEWRAFLAAARRAKREVRTFCFVLAYTGARLSEVLALTPQSIDFANRVIVFECLKRRKRGIFRSVPVPIELIALLERTHAISVCKADPDLCAKRLWPWCRTTAWTRVKELCAKASVPAAVAMPKAFRHSFGVESMAKAGIPIGIVKRWLGHVRLESTIVYCEAVGAEERALAAKMWKLP